MSEITRRTAVAAALAGGASTAFLGDDLNAQQKEEKLTKDQKIIMSAGMNKKEAECWKKTAEAAAAFFAHEELHPLDKAEVATAIHVIQNKLLGRPTYRKYRELHKQAEAKK